MWDLPRCHKESIDDVLQAGRGGLNVPLLSSPPPTTTSSSSSTSSAMKLMPSTTNFFESSFESSNNLISVATLDPTTVLSDALGGLLGSSAILAVPIVAALSVAGLIAFFIVSYANPEDEDD